MAVESVLFSAFSEKDYQANGLRLSADRYMQTRF